ncbi:hypothetical protein AURDEDRAFT_177809 [Auricularia subglabra TFB-10046 SS5]|uniref:Uncharacterized protein n=1 Tax=Auricularia subglabra (strain TFB-10046 / SS5) TaxID=717982 RepID=J0WMR1_AURST|nr:hypothetical protein AURDEDRAFT_177809 [Auricularia subglabra TFB-10046 SS5]
MDAPRRLAQVGNLPPTMSLRPQAPLHRDDTPLNLDDARRAQWDVVSFDCWTSASLGRPPAFSVLHLDAMRPTGRAWLHGFKAACMLKALDQAFGVAKATYTAVLRLDKLSVLSAFRSALYITGDVRAIHTAVPDLTERFWFSVRVQMHKPAAAEAAEGAKRRAYLVQRVHGQRAYSVPADVHEVIGEMDLKYLTGHTRVINADASAAPSQDDIFDPLGMFSASLTYLSAPFSQSMDQLPTVAEPPAPRTYSASHEHLPGLFAGSQEQVPGLSHDRLSGLFSTAHSAQDRFDGFQDPIPVLFNGASSIPVQHSAAYEYPHANLPRLFEQPALTPRRCSSDRRPEAHRPRLSSSGYPSRCGRDK